MDKLYGFKIDDVNGLISIIKNNQNKSKSQIFQDYSIKSGKSVGTVRNLYYALAKRINDDPHTLNKFSMEKIKVNTPKAFSKSDETKLINDVLDLKGKGHSIRNAVNILADGDTKLALRYQNKYRNAVKNNPSLVNENLNTSTYNDNFKPKISEFQMAKLKKEINGLVQKITVTVSKENATLRKRIGELQLENLKLKTMLYNGNF